LGSWRHDLADPDAWPSLIDISYAEICYHQTDSWNAVHLSIQATHATETVIDFRYLGGIVTISRVMSPDRLAPEHQRGEKGLPRRSGSVGRIGEVTMRGGGVLMRNHSFNLPKMISMRL